MKKSHSLPLKIVIARVGESTPDEYGASRTPLDTAEAVYSFWQSVIMPKCDFEADKEHLVAILVNTKLRPNGYHVVSIGSLNETVAHPREIFRAAILLSAYGIILSHNHPSGEPSPSGADKCLTRQINEAARILQIRLLDHVIVGSAELGRKPYFSFQEAGCL